MSTNRRTYDAEFKRNAVALAAGAANVFIAPHDDAAGTDSSALIANYTGGDGNDIIIGSGHNKQIFDDLKDTDSYNAMYDAVRANPQVDFFDKYERVSDEYVADENRLYGGKGDDIIVGMNGADKLYGGEGDDYIYGGAGTDEIRAGKGNDHIFGGKGRDLISGEDGDDTIYGGGGDDSITGGAGNDIIYGDEGSDAISGGDGDDILYGGAGNDQIHGGAGNDYLDGGADTHSPWRLPDLLHGGAGNDLLVYHEGDWVDGHDYTIETEAEGGIDILLLADSGLLSNVASGMAAGHIENIDAIVTEGGDQIHSLDDLLNKGVTLDNANNKIDFSADWTQGATQTLNGQEYIEMDSATNDMTILVQQAMLHNG